MSNVLYRELNNWKAKQLNDKTNRVLIKIKSDILTGRTNEYNFADIKLINKLLKQRTYCG